MKKKRFAMAVVCAVMTIALAGCSMLSSKLNDITGKLVGNSYTITTYDNYGNRVMTTTGDKINVQGNAVETSSYDSDGNVISFPLSLRLQSMERKSRVVVIPVFLRRTR